MLDRGHPGLRWSCRASAIAILGIPETAEWSRIKFITGRVLPCKFLGMNAKMSSLKIIRHFRIVNCAHPSKDPRGILGVVFESLRREKDKATIGEKAPFT